MSNLEIEYLKDHMRVQGWNVPQKASQVDLGSLLGDKTLTKRQIAERIGYMDHISKDYVLNESTKVYLQYKSGNILPFKSIKKVGKYLGISIRNGTDFHINIVNKYFFHKGEYMCISYDSIPLNFSTLEIVTSTTFHIYNTLINRCYNPRLRITLREVFDIFGLPSCERDIKLTLCRYLNIEDLYFGNKGEHSFNPRVTIIATNEHGVSVPYNTMTKAANAFEFSSAKTIAISININKPIPYHGVLWSFRRA